MEIKEFARYNEEPHICMGCTKESCDSNYLKCQDDLLERIADETFERMRDDR